MSKILGIGEIGYGLLIERDAGYVSKDLNPQLINESKLIIKPDEPVLINCVLQKWGVKNKNGRIYPKEVLLPQVEEYRKLVDTNAAVSEADHPDSSVVSLHNISHLIKKMWWGNGQDENVLYGQLEIITSPAYRERGEIGMIGDKIVEYLKRGVRLGISSRGVGSLKEVNGENIVQQDFELICFDLVASPSTPGAYLFPASNEIEISTVGMGENYMSTKTGINENNSKILNAINKFLI